MASEDVLEKANNFAAELNEARTRYQTARSVRSLPLISILFTFAIVLPFALPQWLQGDKLYRVARVEGLYATLQAMKEVSGPVVAIALILAAVFVPVVTLLALVVFGAFYEVFRTLVDYTAPVYWLFLSMSGLAVVVLRLRAPHDRPRRLLAPDHEPEGRCREDRDARLRTPGERDDHRSRLE